MYLPDGVFSPEVKLGLVSASRNCFPRPLSEKRTKALLAQCQAVGQALTVPEGECAIIETRAHARDAAAQLNAAGCDAAVLFLGNFSPEIEDAEFVKAFAGPVMIIAAAEESAASLCGDRGDALCGLLSAMTAISKRGLLKKVHVPERPVVDAAGGCAAIIEFQRIARVVKGIRNATIGLFGPRPRDFETCNYNIASLASIGIEIEELGFFDLVHEIERVRAEEKVDDIIADMRREVPNVPEGEFSMRLATYEKALRNLRNKLRLSGATSQCWSEQEMTLKHVPCYVNGRLASRGFPVACENDAYSLVAELMAQYATDASVTILDLNHSIPANLHSSLPRFPGEDLAGLFHCGNTAVGRMKDPKMHHQVIMKRLMEPEGDPDITRGTIEGQIAASPITVLQVHGSGDRLRAYIAEGEFLDLDPMTFGCTGTAYIPGFGRFYRHVLLGRFHHHAGIAFAHCGGTLLDAFKLLGIEEVYTPLPDCVPYPGENVFRAGLTPKGCR
jgi:L-fucose isomerase-like protein